jgi:hypothetical protein
MMTKSQNIDDDDDDVRQDRVVRENPILRTYPLDKIAISIIGAVLLFMFTQLWSIASKINSLELANAELKGQVTQLLPHITQFVEKGSLTAQRTEIMVANLVERINKFEDFMSKGRRFTAEDGDRLEKRIERLEHNPDKK